MYLIFPKVIYFPMPRSCNYPLTLGIVIELELKQVGSY